MRTNFQPRLRVTLASLLCCAGCDSDASNRQPGADDPPTRTPVDGDDGDGDDDGPDDGVDDDGSPHDDGDDDGTEPQAEPLDADQVRFYLKRIAPTFAGRSLNYDENQQIDAQGEDAIFPIIEAWTTEPGFGEAIRYLVQTQLHASGQNNGIDFELPGNLAAQVAREGLPWTTLLTADYCVDATGAHIECDTGAPYSAGVLATRAYLSANKGRFNLGRAKLMLETFACRVYPMETNVQVPLEKEILIPMFRAETEDEQQVAEAEGGFGNGIGCYFCHSQFGAHAQLFVKYDAEGLFVPDASGLQNPEDELGRSFDGLYTSHMNDPLDAASEASQMFGEPVANLREAAEVLTDSRMFTECTVKSLLANAFGLLAGANPDVDSLLLASLADDVTAIDDDPSIGQYIIEVFTDERVIDAVVATLDPEGE